ncbi:hypothetical protein LDO26_06930 [Luteimonas sp. BDR2-5]|uniref:hypothetical protein n=1 Tax=Proluteimonas luteida TaxID=2878685 RepID=UPI001E2FF39C|nr:hypothetical protein [Luteimonas sp. BDR2-5]MCD9027939.1 hypothetical protein [Luteimonas sp. BDR2-5]
MSPIVRFPAIALLAGAGVLAALPADAAGARTGVHANHGEMVLLRDVNARHAVRRVPPSVGLIVDPTPTAQLAPLLADGELTDADFLALDTGNRVEPGAAQATGHMATTVNSAIGSALGGGPRDGAGASANPLGGALGGTLGTVGATTRGIGTQVTGALAQFPLGQPANGGGP